MCEFRNCYGNTCEHVDYQYCHWVTAGSRLAQPQAGACKTLGVIAILTLCSILWGAAARLERNRCVCVCVCICVHVPDVAARVDGHWPFRWTNMGTPETIRRSKVFCYK